MADQERPWLGARCLPRLRYAPWAANLGLPETVAGPPAMTGHGERIPEGRAAPGIEDTEDLLVDLRQGLAALA